MVVVVGLVEVVVVAPRLRPLVLPVLSLIVGRGVSFVSLRVQERGFSLLLPQ